ncbi:hypothetical protein PybrP1_002083 [[Pythium] brassicae (nom. inval.)]|nr:hypothetical protein PybrP1_002083 [[Pythium] brassicae (nom. inval.)]
MDRFVAGAHFYNYDMFGSLRAGRDAHLLTRAHAGLAAAAFASAFVYVGLRSGLLFMVGAELAFSAHELQAVDRLAELPAAFAFVVGVVMDAAPLAGFHRKSYMIVGLVLVLASLSLLSAAFCFGTAIQNALGGGYIYVVTLLIGTTSVGSMINFVAAHTRVVELSQRESLGDRGILQAHYLVARVSGQATARISVFAISQVDASLHVPLVMLAVSTVSIASLATVILYLDEGEDRRRRSIRTECAVYWTLTQQKALWRILGFVSTFAFALGFKFKQAQRAVQAWSRVESMQQDTLLSSIAADGVMLGAVLLWRWCFMNSLWRRVFSLGPIVAIVSQLLLLTLTTSGVFRHPAFFVFATSLTGVPTALLALSTLVPVTEIAQESSEGGVAGLALSFYTISKVFASTFLSALQHAAVFEIGEPVVEDSQRVRSLVAAAQVATIAVHALALGGIALLPLQKLDAQQLRMFGGFTRRAAPVAVVAGAGLLLYCVVFNVLLLIPSTATLFVTGDSGDDSERGHGAAGSNDTTRIGSR